VRLRLVLLAVVAAASAAVAGLAGKASAGKDAVVPARIAALPARPVYPTDCGIPPAFRPAFEDAARRTRLPLGLLVAVARVESHVRQDAVSRAGARGILQVLPTTAAALRLDPDDPSANVLAGARYLRQLRARLGSLDLALAAYNAGPTAVERFGGAPTGETLTYVFNVAAVWRSLRGCR